MNEYDFGRLHHEEFEQLVNALVAAELGVNVEGFKPGPDGGIDGRFYEVDDLNNDKKCIIQSKHYLKTGYDGLISHLTKKKGKNEVEKVNLLEPHRYIFATSVKLSPINKKNIMSIFDPYILRTDDIWGQTEIAAHLGKHLQIERQFYKLWLSSSNVLFTVLHNDVVERSRGESQRMVDFLHRYYVTTENHQRAFSILSERGILLITGAAGIGKTILAEQLCVELMADEFEFNAIKAIRDAESVLRPEQKQVFYFDDFLGSNFLSALERNEDSEIVDFIRRIQKDNNKRFIMTSRTTILSRGKVLGNRFNGNIEQYEFELTLDSVTEFERACMLRNHLYLNLEQEYIDTIINKKRYWSIITHRNFTPRIIESITSSHRINRISLKEYWDYAKDMLDNPHKMWEDVYENQIGDEVRSLVNLVAFAGTHGIMEEELEQAYNRLRDTRVEELRDLPFDRATEQATGDVLERYLHSQPRIPPEYKLFDPSAEYKLFNPSLGDYIYKRFANNRIGIESMIGSLRSYDSVSFLQSMREDSKYLSEENYQTIVNNLLCRDLNNKYASSEYKIKLCFLYVELNNRDSGVDKYLPEFLYEFKFRVISNEDNYDLFLQMVDILRWVLKNSIVDAKQINLDLSELPMHFFDHSDFVALSALLNFDKDSFTDESFDSELVTVLSDLLDFDKDLFSRTTFVDSLVAQIKNYWVKNAQNQFQHDDSIDLRGWENVIADGTEKWHFEQFLRRKTGEYGEVISERVYHDLCASLDGNLIVEMALGELFDDDYPDYWRRYFQDKENDYEDENTVDNNKNEIDRLFDDLNSR